MCRSEGCDVCDNGGVIANVKKLARQGDTEGAWDVVLDVLGDNPCCRTNAVFAIACVTGRSEHFDDAAASASYIEDGCVKASLLSAISVAREVAPGSNPSF